MKLIPAPPASEREPQDTPAQLISTPQAAISCWHVRCYWGISMRISMPASLHAPAPLPRPASSAIGTELACRELSDLISRSLAAHQRLGLDHLPFRLALKDGTLELHGEVPSLEVKRRALQVAAALRSVVHVVDELRVAPACRMSDATIADHVVEAFMEEPAFCECSIQKRVSRVLEDMREPAGAARGELRVTVHDGVVTLQGTLPTRAHERIAGVLAWWVPGTRDVIYRIAITSPEPDSDGQVGLAVRAALAMDPFLDAGQIRVDTRDRSVTLSGLVWSRDESKLAERDAWYVAGVTDVVNALQVADERRGRAHKDP